MIEDHVQNHADTGAMQGLDHVAEFVSGAAWIAGVVGMRGKKAVGAVAPVVGETQACGLWRHVLQVEGHDRQQFHVGDAKRLQVRDFFNDGLVGAGVLGIRGWMSGEAPYVHFVDHSIHQREMAMSDALPVVLVAHQLRAHGGAQVVARYAGFLSIPQPIADGAAPGIEQNLFAVETAAAFARVGGAVHAPAVIEGIRQIFDQHMPEKKGTVDFGIELHAQERLGAVVLFEQEQFRGGRLP